MSHWFIPRLLSDEAARAALAKHELALPAEGLPDISRAQGPDQIREWLKQLHPEATPETIGTLTDHFWHLARELHPEDTVILPLESGYLIGEIAGTARKEDRADGAFHVWPAEWHGGIIAADALPLLKSYAACGGITEIADEDALKSLAPYIPALRKNNAKIFRWVGISILFFELIYFWPKG